jgi:hypothetical protein
MFKLKTSKNVGGGEGGYAKAPAGNHPAVLVGIIDLGTQLEEFQGESKWRHQVYLVWELVEEPVDGVDRNHVIAAVTTLSMNEKAKLRKWIEARRGKPLGDDQEFELSEELGQPCLLNVVMKGDWPKVEGVSAILRGMQVKAPKSKLFTWSLETYQRGTPIEIPDWVPYFYGRPVTEQIRACKELTGGANAAPPSRPSAQQQQPPAASGGNPPPPPPRRMGGSPAPAPQPVFYVDAGTGNTLQMTRQEIEQAIQGGECKPEELQICPMGGNEWKTLIEVFPDFKDPIPF